MIKLSLPLTFHAYQVAHLYADDSEIRRVLGEPHYIETDSTRTFGGHESLWAYRIGGDEIAILCRIPYGESVIISKTESPEAAINKIISLFPDSKIEKHEIPFKI